MKRTLLLVFTGAMGTLMLFSSSCKKAAENNNTQTATDNAICEGEYMRMAPTANSIAVKSNGNGVGRLESAYPITTVDTTHGWPHTLTINYGPSPGVVDSSDGKTRSGQIVMAFSNYWHINGTTVSVTYTNYFVNDIQFQGVVSLTRNSKTSFSETVSNGQCTKASPAWTILYNATRTFTWTAGVGDSIPSHSTFIISGNANGTDRNGLTYTMNITNPIVKPGSCAYITQGTYTMQTSDGVNYTVDFGNGTCDNQATVTINGNSFPITLL